MRPILVHRDMKIAETFDFGQTQVAHGFVEHESDGPKVNVLSSLVRGDIVDPFLS